MSERKVWTAEEDQVLKEIFLVRKIQKWSSVSRIMEVEYNLLGRTGKQCRQRWHNQLDPHIKIEAWADDEEAKLFKWHLVHGNKWAKIAQHLPGRTDNAIKNHFYSTLRKGLRRLNRYISEQRNVLKIKPIKSSLLQKIITLSGDRTEKKNCVNYTLIDKCGPIIQKLVICSKEGDFDQGKTRQMRSLTDDILEFDNKFQRRKYTKRKRQQDESGSEQEEKEEKQEKAEELMPAPSRPQQGFKRSASLVRKPSRSILIGTDRYRSRELDDDFGFNDPPANNKYFMTSSLESISILSSFQRRPSEPDLQYALFNNPVISVDQAQGNSLLLNSTNISDLMQATNNGSIRMNQREK